MRHIAYTSTADNLTAEEFAEIVAASKERNRTIGVRGAIAFDGRIITQILEGPADVVDALYAKILADPRHGGVVLTARADISETQFASFGMVQRSPSELYLMSSGIIEHFGEGDTAGAPLHRIP